MLRLLSIISFLFYTKASINLSLYNSTAYFQLLSNTTIDNKPYIISKFQDFVTTYTPSYSSETELRERLNIFSSNLLKSDNDSISQLSDRKQQEILGLITTVESDPYIENVEIKGSKLKIYRPIHNETFVNNMRYTFRFNYTTASQRIYIKFVSNISYWLNKNLPPNKWLNQYTWFSFKPTSGSTTTIISDGKLAYSPSGVGYLIFTDNEGNYDYVQVNINNYNFPVPKISYLSPPMRNHLSPINWCETNNPFGRSMCSPVKTQKCGCCWAYNAATLLETSYSIVNNLKTPAIMPPEQIMTCVPPRLPCRGGSDQVGMRYALSKGMQGEEQYPPSTYKYIYNNTNIPLVCNDTGNIRYTFPDYCVYKNRDVATIKKFLNLFGSAMVGIDGNIFYLGKSIVTSNVSCSVKNINHAVNLVGWDIENKTEYWIIRNSWGNSWGLKGFAKIAIDPVSNPCGILDGITFTGPCILGNPRQSSPPITPPPTTRPPITSTPSISIDIPTYCKTYGYPSLDNKIRLYSSDECKVLLKGNFINGECLIMPAGGSYSWNCRGLNLIRPTTRPPTTRPPTTRPPTTRPPTTRPPTTRPPTTRPPTTRPPCNENYPIPSTVFLNSLTSINSPLVKLSKIKPIKIIFFGDSITYLGLYQQLIVDKIKSSTSFVNDVSIINKGLNGGTIKDLIIGVSPWGNSEFSFLETLNEIKPDIVVVQIGLNDIYQKNNCQNRCSDVVEFKRLLSEVISPSVKCVKAQLVLTSLTTIGENIGTSSTDIELDTFSNAVRDVSPKLNATFVDLRSAYKEYEKTNNCKNINSGLLTYDGIHPNSRGAVMLANMNSQGILAASLLVNG